MSLLLIDLSCYSNALQLFFHLWPNLFVHSWNISLFLFELQKVNRYIYLRYIYLPMAKLFTFEWSRERARTQAPTIRNCTVELPTFVVIAGVSPGEVQCKSLTLEEAPSWSGLLPRQVSMTFEWTSGGNCSRKARNACGALLSTSAFLLVTKRGRSRM